MTQLHKDENDDPCHPSFPPGVMIKTYNVVAFNTGYATKGNGKKVSTTFVKARFESAQNQSMNVVKKTLESIDHHLRGWTSITRTGTKNVRSVARGPMVSALEVHSTIHSLNMTNEYFN